MGLNPFCGWSSLLYFMPLELEMGYDPTNPYNDRILPPGCQELGLTFPEK